MKAYGSDWPRFILRTSLLLLVFSTAPLGVLATFAPYEFYTSFPVGLGWVEKLPPYNQHLVTDVGGFYLAFTLLFVWCLVTLSSSVIVPVMVSWILAATIHSLYHLLHLETFDLADAVAQMISLTLVLLLPVVALIFRRTGEPD